MQRLPETVGSTLSLNAIREDLQISHKTVSNWCDSFEKLYAVFRLKPYGSPLIKAVKKEPKLYFYDWNLIKNPGARFENLVACHLLKWVHFMQDTEGRDFELRYFRTVDGKEVDFVILEGSTVHSLIEAKLSDTTLSPSLIYLHHKLLLKNPNLFSVQLTAQSTKDFQNAAGIRCMPALKYLRTLV
jgi:predicted AAA+ superfamily ATPase